MLVQINAGAQKQNADDGDDEGQPVFAPLPLLAAFYLCLAIASACLTYPSTLFVVWIPGLLAITLTLLFLAWRYEGRWLLKMHGCVRRGDIVLTRDHYHQYEHTRAALADWGVPDVDALLVAGVAVQAPAPPPPPAA